MNDQPREVMSWEELGRGARELATAVRDDGFAPDLVLGIARGGLLVAGALGDRKSVEEGKSVRKRV